MDEEKKDVKPGRVLTPEGKARRDAVGSKNLSVSRSAAYARRRDLQREVDVYHAALLADAGPNHPTATKIGLIQAATTTYASLLQVSYDVLRSSRSERIDLAERVSWLTSNLLRCLRMLDLDAKPRPRPFAELFSAKAAAKPTIQEPETDKSGAKTDELRGKEQ